MSQYVAEAEAGINDGGKMINQDSALLQLFAASEELEIFASETVQQMIDYKWNRYAVNHHYFGLGMHCYYILMLALYTYFIYMLPYTEAAHTGLTIALATGIIYPWVYESIQLRVEGARAYFRQSWNYIDFVYCYSSIVNLIL